MDKIAPNIGIVVQARMLSSRLPGKSMMKIGGRPMLGYLLHSLMQVATAKQIVVVTSEDASNGPIVALSKQMGCAVFQGSEHDVASRYKAVLNDSSFEFFHRICGDSPYFSAEVLLEPSNTILNNRVDFISSMPNRGYPMGNNVELLRTKFFLDCFDKPGLIHKEHVTANIYKHAADVPHILVGAQIQDYNYDRLKFSVDTADDFNVAERVLERLSFEPWKSSFEEKYNLIENLT